MPTRALKLDSAPLAQRAPSLRAKSWVTRASRRLRRWAALSRQRRTLAQLDDRLLADVGLDRAAAARESARWFWDEPA